MDTKKLIIAIVVAYIILFVSGYLVHQVWLGATYEAMRADDFSFRPLAGLQRKLWIIWISDLIYTILFVWLYTKGVEAKPWLGQGLRYGALMAFFTAVPQTLNEYVVYYIPYTLAIKWMVAGFVTLMVMGVAVAGIYRSRDS